jgi:hypothetical protein
MLDHLEINFVKPLTAEKTSSNPPQYKSMKFRSQKEIVIKP